MGGVRRAAALHFLIMGRSKRPRLGPFLHGRLGVAGGLGLGGDPVAPGVQNQRLGRREAAVDEHRSDQGFTHIAKDRLLLAPPAPRFAETQRDMGADVPLGGDLGAGFAPHELGEPHRQFALARLRKGLVKPARDHNAQHPVAQEFEPLIGLRPALPARILRRKMREREHGQREIAKAVTEAGLERGQFGARLFVHCPTDRGAGPRRH